MKKKTITVAMILMGLATLAMYKNEFAGVKVREDFQEEKRRDPSRSKDEICDELKRVYENNLNKKREEFSTTTSSKARREIRLEIYRLILKLQALPVLRKFLLQ